MYVLGLFPELCRVVLLAHKEVGLVASGHDGDHDLQVGELAYRVAKDINVAAAYLAAAAGLLHSIDRILERRLNIETSTISTVPENLIQKEVVRMLTEYTPIAAAWHQRIVDAVVHHGSKPNQPGDDLVTIAVADADRLANMGADLPIRSGQYYSKLRVLNPQTMEIDQSDRSPRDKYNNPDSVLYLLRRRFTEEVFLSSLLVTGGLAVAVVSNVFSGVDLEAAVHIGRFVELWAAIMLCLGVWYMWQIELSRWKAYFSVALLVGVVCSGFVFQFRVWNSVDADVFKNDSFQAPLNWLAMNAPAESVVLANDRIASYIPVVTRSYVLFHPNAELYMMSDHEVEDRYLASRSLGRLSVDQIKANMRLYAGAGHTVHAAMVHNRAVKVCNLLHVSVIGVTCGAPVTAYSLKGDQYFNDLKNRFDTMKKNPAETLVEYNVRYIITDATTDAWKIPTSYTRVWTDGRFSVYALK